MGASIFYHSPPESETQKSDDVSALDSELKSGAKNVKEAEKEQQNLSSLVIFWSQDPYNWYVIVVVGPHSKVLIENNQNWKLLELYVAKIESCQNWKLPKLKVAKIENC